MQKSVPKDMDRQSKIPASNGAGLPNEHADATGPAISQLAGVSHWYAPLLQSPVEPLSLPNT
jgi:hypothetical protein